MKLMSNIIMFSPLLNRHLVKYGTWVESSPVPCCIISFFRKRHTCLFTGIQLFFSHKSKVELSEHDHVAHKD